MIALLATRSPTHHRRTPNRTYDVSDLMECAIALQMQRGFVDPAMSAAVVIGRRAALHEAWRRAIIKRDDYLLQVALNAFAEAGSRANQDATPAEANLGRSHATNLLPMLTINVGELADRAFRALEAMEIVTPHDLAGAMLKQGDPSSDA